MKARNEDLHGNAPDVSPVTLVLVDVINPMDFPEADLLLRYALPAAERLADLKRRAREAGAAIIYANDNFGRWRSDLSAVVERCLEPGSRGRPICELLRPDPDDYFVLKPKHSGFFSTTLELLLRYLRTETLVLGGFAGNICVLFTANDAYLRDLELVVPSDGIASNTQKENDEALEMMRRILKCDVRPTAQIDFKVMLGQASPGLRQAKK